MEKHTAKKKSNESESKTKKPKVKKVGKRNSLVVTRMSNTRRDKVAAALLAIAHYGDGIEGEDPKLTNEERRDLYELTDLVISLWDALNG